MRKHDQDKNIYSTFNQRQEAFPVLVSRAINHFRSSFESLYIQPLLFSTGNAIVTDEPAMIFPSDKEAGDKHDHLNKSPLSCSRHPSQIDFICSFWRRILYFKIPIYKIFRANQCLALYVRVHNGKGVYFSKDILHGFPVSCTLIPHYLAYT